MFINKCKNILNSSAYNLIIEFVIGLYTVRLDYNFPQKYWHYQDLCDFNNYCNAF